MQLWRLCLNVLGWQAQDTNLYPRVTCEYSQTYGIMLSGAVRDAK